MLSLPIISFSSRNKALYVIIHRQPIKHKPGSALVGSSHPIFREGRKQEYFCEVRWLGRWVTGLPSRLGFVVRGLCLGLIRSEVEVPSSCMGFLGRVRHFAVWLIETGTAKGELKCRISAALSEWEMALGPTLPAVVSAQDRFVWILCRTQVPEELFFFTTQVGGAAAFFILGEKCLERYMVIGAMTGSCVTLCTQMSMLSSNERSNCIFSKWLWIFKLFDIKRNSFI